MKNRPTSRKYRKPIVSESLILSNCIKYLYAIGLQPIRNNSGAHKKEYTDKHGVTRTHYVRYGKKGTGDLLVCTKYGVWCEIEVKSEAGKPSLEQLERQEHIRRCHGAYLIVHSLDELIEAMKPLLVPF